MRCGECEFYKGGTFGKCNHNVRGRHHKNDLCWRFGKNHETGVSAPMFKAIKKPETNNDYMKEEVFP